MAFNPKEYLAEEAVNKNQFNPKQYLAEEQGLAPTPQQQPNKTESFWRSAANVANVGLQDEIEGAIGGATRGAKYLAGQTKGDKGLFDAISGGYKSDRDASRAYDKAASETNPITSTLGQYAAIAPTLAAPISLSGIVNSGLASGFGNSTATNPIDLAGDAAKGGLISGAVAKAPEGLLNNPITKYFKTTEALKALGAQKPQLRNMPQKYKDDTAQYALDNGLINPLKSVTNKQAKAQALQRQTGARMGEATADLPSTSVDEIKSLINSKLKFDPTQPSNAPLTQQRDLIFADLKNKMDGSGNINAKDLLDIKASYFDQARKGRDEVNLSKDTIEQARQGIGKYIEGLANSPQYTGDLKNYAMDKKIQTLLSNKASQSGNSLLGMGGFAGMGASIVAASNGHPGMALAGALGVPVVRSKIGETASVSIDKLQKLAAAGKLDPKIAAYLISRQQSSETSK